MDDTQRIVKCGNLSLHTPGGFFKKRWHGKYLVLYDGSKSGVKRLELFDSEIKFKKQNPAKIIPLVDCVRIVTCQRYKSTFTFEVRTIDQFYLLASKSFQDMNDWVNCLRLVAFGQTQLAPATPSSLLTTTAAAAAAVSPTPDARIPVPKHTTRPSTTTNQRSGPVDVLLERRTSGSQSTSNPAPQVSAQSNGGGAESALTASQAAAAAARARQRQPSLLGTCKPQPPTDSPFIKQDNEHDNTENNITTLDTLTPTVRGQLIAGQKLLAPLAPIVARKAPPALQIQPTLDEEEENMLYCSIEDNPSEHNYRVKVIETELALRCQLKCYQLTGSKLVSQQYEELAHFRNQLNSNSRENEKPKQEQQLTPIVTFYQLIIGPQELTLLNDYATARSRLNNSQQQQQQQGLWSWPYQCIRRYGFDKDNCFMFEAGRKCTSGPGQFVVQTPKAYNIYQDVVKFVNELRTVTATAHAPTGPLDQSTGSGKQPFPVVTQIPVIWTPSTGGQQQQQPPSGSQTREQFFEALRQMETTTTPADNAQAIQQLIDSSSPISHEEGPLDKTQKQQQQQPTHRQRQTKASSTTSDESGYEQGDESTLETKPEQPRDMKPSQTTTATSRLLNRQKLSTSTDSSISLSPSSLSSAVSPSASSSSPSSSAGSSPGQSVSRRTGESMQKESRQDKSHSDHNGPPGVSQYLVDTRLALNRVSGDPTRKETQGLIPATTMNNNNNNNNPSTNETDDFGVNLIRDVYSEITKLHAKFAVVSTSSAGDDSMSSDSRESSGVTSDRPGGDDGHDVDDDDEEDDDDDEEEEDEEHDGGCYYMNEEPLHSDDQDLAEPMYSNLRPITTSRGLSHHQRQPPYHCSPMRDIQTYNSNNPADHHFSHHPPLSPQMRPIYPTILKPIPEINENTPRESATLRTTVNHKPPIASRLTSQTELRDLESLPPTKSRSQPSISRNAIRRNNTSEQESNIRGGSVQNRNSKLDRSKPTNHYVINDVQYAKISRNLASSKFR